jgi:hypothetical protein
LSARIPVYAAERRILDVHGVVLSAQDTFRFRPFRPSSRTSEYGAVVTDAAALARLAIVVPAGLEARLQDADGETWLCLYDAGMLVDFLPPRDAVEAAAEGKYGLYLSRVAPAPLPSAN